MTTDKYHPQQAVWQLFFLQPLVDNPGLDKDDGVDITYNCLDLAYVPGGRTDSPNIYELINDRGVNLAYLPQWQHCTANVTVAIDPVAIDPVLNQRGFVCFDGMGDVSVHAG